MPNSQKLSLKDFVRHNDYPGRFIGVGISNDSKSLIIIYAITARSQSSRNRILVFENGIVRTAQADPKKDVGVKNITLYPAIMKTSDNRFVVSNGVQTEPIVRALEKGRTLKAEYENWDFEPDSSSTERISLVVSSEDINFARVSDSNGNSKRDFYEIKSKDLKPGELAAISTYSGNGEPPPSSFDAPYKLLFDGDESKIARLYSQNLPFFLSVAVVRLNREKMQIEDVAIINSQKSA